MPRPPKSDDFPDRHTDRDHAAGCAELASALRNVSKAHTMRSLPCALAYLPVAMIYIVERLRRTRGVSSQVTPRTCCTSPDAVKGLYRWFEPVYRQGRAGRNQSSLTRGHSPHRMRWNSERA